MASYISSNHERLYARVEPSFGHAMPATGNSRFPVVKFFAHQQTDQPRRRDKTGTRTHLGLPGGLRRQTNFEVRTYMTAWTETAHLPPHGNLIHAALGGTPHLVAGRELAGGSTSSTLQFVTAHGLLIGDGVTFGDEIRFVESVPTSQTVVVNQPFSKIPVAGLHSGATASFRPADELPSLSVFSYRSPATALQRFLTGAAVDQMTLTVNGDFHEFQFLGQAKDLVDHLSFESPVGSLSSFPTEPTLEQRDHSIVPGHLGQAWLGSVPTRFLTVTDAEVNVDNQLDLRDREFGGDGISSVVAGERNVSLRFSLFEKDDESTISLYHAAKSRSPISVMFQLGQRKGQLFGIWMKNVIPEVPEFDDGETRVQWRFNESRALGKGDDEIFIAFG